MGRTKFKKNSNEAVGEDDDTSMGGEVVSKVSFERAVSKWKSETCYQHAMCNMKHISDAAFLHIPSTLLAGSKTTLLSWLNDQGLTGSSDNTPNTLRSILLSEGNSANVIEPWRHQVMSRTSAFNGDAPARSSEVIDMYINAGGPIWSTAFAPTSELTAHDEDVYADASLDRYVAVGVSQIGHRVELNSPSDGEHVLGQSETNNNLIQIWRIHGTYTHPRKAKFPTKPIPAYLLKKKAAVDPNHVPKPKGRPRKYPKVDVEGEGKAAAAPATTPARKSTAAVATPATPAEEDPAMDVDEEPEVAPASDVSAELVYCVALQGRGPSWSCAWSPLAPPAASEQLGLLAVVNGDGTCLILQLPKSLADNAARRGAQFSSDEDGFRQNTPVVAEAAVTLREVSVPGLLVCSVAWSTESAHLFGCGMSDGSLMLWDLKKSSGSAEKVLSVPQRHMVDVLILESQIPSMAAVRALHFCPYDSSLIITCGQEDMKIWSLKDSTGPVFRKAALSSTAAIGWDPTGFGFYFGDSETTSLTWNPLWGANLRSLFRKELYTHADVGGGLWGMDCFVNESLSFVLTTASDGSVRGGFPALMTSFKPKNASALQLGRIRSAQPSADGASWEVCVESAVQILPSAIGAETFPQSSDMAVHAVHSTHLGRVPTLTTEPVIDLAPSAPSTVPKRTYKKKSAAVVIDSDSDREATAPRSAKKKTPSKKQQVDQEEEEEEEDSDDEDFSAESEEEDDLVDSDSEDSAAPKSKSKGKSNAKKSTQSMSKSKLATPKAAKKPPKSAAKTKESQSAQKTPARTVAMDFSALYAPQPAGLRLVAYGGQVGLLRIHSFDPLRALIAPSQIGK